MGTTSLCLICLELLWMGGVELARCILGSRQLKLNSKNVCQCHLHPDIKPHSLFLLLIFSPLNTVMDWTQSQHIMCDQNAQQGVFGNEREV